jgi:PAS domain S-box-containing protein
VYAAFLADVVFAGALVWQDGGLASSLYLLFALLALKALALALAWPGMVWLPFAGGPVYAVALRLAAGNFAFLADQGFLSRYLLLWVWLIGAVLVAWELARRAAHATALDAALKQQQVALAQKTEVLQRTATDLGDRVLELRSLQEVAKALASTQRLEETLQLIAERLRGVTGSSHCAAALLEDDQEYLVGTVVADAVSSLGDEARPPSQAESFLAAQEVTRLTRNTAHAFRLALADEPAVAAALRADRVTRAPLGPASERAPLGPVSERAPLGPVSERAPLGPVSDRARGELRQLLGGNSYLIMPLVSRGRPIGALFLADPARRETEDRPPQKRDGTPYVSEQLMASFAYFAATAIENARLYQDAWEKRRELEAVLAGIGDGVIVADPDLHLILMNPVARTILGVEEEPPAGVPLRPYLAAPAFADLMAETLHSQEEIIRELELNELARTYGTVASPVLDADGKVRGVVAVLRDITAQKELERMKSNFLSVVSHELRTPLHSIKGFIEIILMGKTGPVTELQEDFLRTVRSQTTVLQRMIDDLLEFSRMEAGRVRLQVSEVALAGVAHAVASRLAPLAEENRLHLAVQVPDNLPEIDGDRVRLEQVLTNLVENAIKFTPPGGEVYVSGEFLGDRVRLTIADTGIGIPPDEQEKIFDRFYQVDGSERRAYRGAGLGLSICKHIVERHSGRIWVESDGISGHGSRFHVELPVELRLAEAPTIDFTTSVR